jgi:hypothetical protein
MERSGTTTYSNAPKEGHFGRPSYEGGLLKFFYGDFSNGRSPTFLGGGGLPCAPPHLRENAFRLNPHVNFFLYLATAGENF